MTNAMPANHARQLLALNLALQGWDLALTQWGLSMGYAEGNPLIASAIALWGATGALLGFKAFACAMLLYLAQRAPVGLAPYAGIVLCTAIIPWTFILATHAA